VDKTIEVKGERSILEILAKLKNKIAIDYSKLD
jgi:hypothetical protein